MRMQRVRRADGRGCRIQHDLQVFETDKSVRAGFGRDLHRVDMLEVLVEGDVRAGFVQRGHNGALDGRPPLMAVKVTSTPSVTSDENVPLFSVNVPSEENDEFVLLSAC